MLANVFLHHLDEVWQGQHRRLGELTRLTRLEVTAEVVAAGLQWATVAISKAERC